jgi:uncharacterized protein (TIGR02611 family)
MNQARKTTRRLIVAIVGGVLVVAGIFMLMFPGPGILTLAAGLALLSTEFAWAQEWLAKMRRKISKVGRDQRLKGRREP